MVFTFSEKNLYSRLNSLPSMNLEEKFVSILAVATKKGDVVPVWILCGPLAFLWTPASAGHGEFHLF